jgi:hypothetical protein
MAEFDHKEYARQMRENCAKDQNGNIICSAELWEQIASIIESTANVVPKSEVDDLKRYIILNENIAIKCKRENGEQNEEYWKGKISAFKQIRAYIDAELKKKYTESEDKP